MLGKNWTLNFEKKHMLLLQEIYDLLYFDKHFLKSRRNKKISKKRLRKLEEIAKEYLLFFEKYPEKTHLFPLTGTIFQYYFAKGALAGSSIKNQRKIKLCKEPTNKSSEKLTRLALKNLDLRKTGIVLHDYIASGRTKSIIAKVSGVPEKEIIVHELNKKITGINVKISAFDKWIGIDCNKIITKKEHDSKYICIHNPKTDVSKKEITIIKKALFSAGVQASYASQ